MGPRSRLFASAAFPLLSLSLMFQPAGAALIGGPAVTVLSAGSHEVKGIEVAQEQAPPPADGQASEEELQRKHKKHGGEAQGEGQPPAPAQAEKPQRPAEPAQTAPAPQAQPAQEQAAPAQEEQQPHRKHKQQEEPAAQAAPAPEQPQAAAPAQEEQQPRKKHKQEEPAQAEPTAPAQQQAAPAEEAQPPVKKHKQQAEPAAKAAPAEPAQAQPAAPVQPAAPQTEQAAPAQEQQPQPQKKREKKHEQAAEPAQAPAAAEGAKPAVEPQKPAQQPAAAEKAPAPAEKAPAAEGAAAPAKPEAAPAVPSKAEAPAAPAAPTGEAQQAAPAPAGEQVSPAELERRKKIAENPAAATGPVILPVQNGAAVLDSDKDTARRGQRGQRQETQGQAAQPAAPAAAVRAPTSDADAQRAAGGNQPPVRIEAVTSEQGRRLDRRPSFAAPQGAQMQDSQDNRVIINFGDDVYVRHDDTRRFTRDGERPTYEQLSRDRYRETIARPDGDRIVTVRNRYGDIVQRSRIDARGREYVLFYSPELEDQPNRDDYFRDPGDELPPMRLRIPLNQYIIDTSADDNRDYYDFLREPPVEQVERVYSLNEVRYSARIRDKVRRIDLDTITFATASAEIPMAQAKTLRGIADAISKIVQKDPSETFLIEGHTDAVGSAQSNLVLSDQRAESVANVLTDVYGIPPENLTTQGYGEQYLKVNTQGPEQENRRVTIRRVTALVRPVAQRN